ncbi:MAG: PAAR-like domain-containing protein [Byssovorax sp.]
MAATLPAATKEGGTALATPDTCHIPAPPPPAGPGGIPTPFPNTAMLNSTDKATDKVLFSNKGVCVEDSEIPSSHGDEPGVSNLPTPKGLMSQKNMGKVVFKQHSGKVKAQGKGVVMLTAMTAHNGDGNANMPAGTHTVPSQTKVIVSP